MKFIRRRSSLTDVSFTQALHSETQAPLEGAENYGCFFIYSNPYECHNHCRSVGYRGGSCAPGGSADRSGGRGARRGRRPCGARGGAGCPNLPQRPGSRRSAGGDGLVKVADLG